MRNVPTEICDTLRRARRLEWWTLFWQATIVVGMYFAIGSSQSMKSAWVEDLLGLLPATTFLIALHFEQKRPTERFPFGYARFNSLAFLVSATGLVVMGLFLVYDSLSKLVQAEHPTIGPAPFFGADLWMGWVMVAVLAYSVVPPVILGRLKIPLARKLQDKVLYTDALMQKADWMTGLAGAFGVIGVGLGWWWADSVAALIISVNIINDGRKALTISAAELVDGTPRKLDTNEIAEDAKRLEESLKADWGAGHVKLRECGRYIFAEVDRLDGAPTLDQLWPAGQERPWRLASVSKTLRVRETVE
ncbi:cobalt transporter [Roseovarius sp. HI0049]|nr:cobalt transporter [Roseovarius sp. HI0049]